MKFKPEEIAEFDKSRVLNDAELLKKGANFKVSPEGRSQLILTEAQVDKSQKDRPESHETKERKLGNPESLIEAIKDHDVVTFTQLEDKVDLNATGSLSKLTPLIVAIQEKDAVIFGLLISDKRVDINARDSEGRTPLQHAIKTKNLAAKVLLLSKGAVE